jgi:hypothetical protein
MYADLETTKKKKNSDDRTEIGTRTDHTQMQRYYVPLLKKKHYDRFSGPTASIMIYTALADIRV